MSRSRLGALWLSLKAQGATHWPFDFSSASWVSLRPSSEPAGSTRGLARGGWRPGQGRNRQGGKVIGHEIVFLLRDPTVQLGIGGIGACGQEQEPPDSQQPRRQHAGQPPAERARCGIALDRPGGGRGRIAILCLHWPYYTTCVFSVNWSARHLAPHRAAAIDSIRAPGGQYPVSKRQNDPMRDGPEYLTKPYEWI